MNRTIAIASLFSFLALLALIIFALLGKAVDKSIENDDARIREHKAQIYISATDQAIIDWRQEK